MSKLSQVKKALEENSAITIIAIKDINYLPGKRGYFSHTIDFLVAPATGTVSKAEELQALIMSLVPEVEPTMIDEFYEAGDSTKGFVDGKIELKNKEKVKRRIWIRLYPNIQTAMSAEKGIDEYYINKKTLGNKTKDPRNKGFFSRLFG